MHYEEFVESLTDAYEHLYDLVYLRSQPLLAMLVPGENRKETTWQLHHLLITALDELDPGPQAPVFSREWRRHRLMMAHYVDGLAPQAVADMLAISRRHYYREHESALKAVASILWSRYTTMQSAPLQPATAEPDLTKRLELIRVEAARAAQLERQTLLNEVIDSALALLAENLAQHRIEVQYSAGTNRLSSDGRLLRQLILALLSYLVEQTADTVLCISERVSNAHVEIAFTTAAGLRPGVPANTGERLMGLMELAMMSGATLETITSGSQIDGFKVQLSLQSERPTILVIDDNRDTLELFSRYLEANGYTAASAATAAQALQLAQTSRLFAIILDLMMPEQDGWDLLQHFLNHAGTQTIPVIICSILRQKELALSLGAAAFLQKPVVEDLLIATLESLKSS